ncbi:Calponin-2 [Saguinus oedipus]|uniref:Calponin n=1 Tax=Saguinus oedipus TaxID=9490 RepID=A0ABQ9VW73_SAGOE|nr:Calponin-2 [Saguinus oedipus]
MSSTQLNKGPSYGLSAEVKNWVLSKYDPQKEAELRDGLRDSPVSPSKDGIILCTLMNKLQPGSVPKINCSMQNWHQLENLSNFIKAVVSYGMNPVEANDLFESGNMTQNRVDIGVKYLEKQERNFDDATMKAGQGVIGLQMGTNKCASQSGMTADGRRRHLLPQEPHPAHHGPLDHQPPNGYQQMDYSRAPTRAARSSAWACRYTTPSTARKAQCPTGLPPMLATARAPGEVPEHPPYHQEELYCSILGNTPRQVLHRDPAP